METYRQEKTNIKDNLLNYLLERDKDKQIKILTKEDLLGKDIKGAMSKLFDW